MRKFTPWIRCVCMLTVNVMLSYSAIGVDNLGPYNDLYLNDSWVTGLYSIVPSQDPNKIAPNP